MRLRPSRDESVIAYDHVRESDVTRGWPSTRPRRPASADRARSSTDAAQRTLMRGSDGPGATPKVAGPNVSGGHAPIVVSRPATRGILVGLAISLLTGVLLFATRATTASANGFFQAKMALLIAAAAFHLAIHRSVVRREGASVALRRLTAGIGLLLWTGLALAGCAFILLE